MRSLFCLITSGNISPHCCSCLQEPPGTAIFNSFLLSTTVTLVTNPHHQWSGFCEYLKLFFSPQACTLPYRHVVATCLILNIAGRVPLYCLPTAHFLLAVSRLVAACLVTVPMTTAWSHVTLLGSILSSRFSLSPSGVATSSSTCFYQRWLQPWSLKTTKATKTFHFFYVVFILNFTNLELTKTENREPKLARRQRLHT